MSNKLQKDTQELLGRATYIPLSKICQKIESISAFPCLLAWGTQLFLHLTYPSKASKLDFMPFLIDVPHCYFCYKQCFLKNQSLRCTQCPCTLSQIFYRLRIQLSSQLNKLGSDLFSLCLISSVINTSLFAFMCLFLFCYFICVLESVYNDSKPNQYLIHFST